MEQITSTHLGSLSICPFWACLPYVPDFRKKIAHFWARMINVAENCNENRKISCLNLIYFYRR